MKYCSPIMSRRSRAQAALIAAALLSAALPLAAHHGTNISYDRTKQFTKEATVVKFEYKNPHPELWVDFKDDNGQVAALGAGAAAESRAADSQRLESPALCRGDERPARP
jgi:hypothetical protein